MLRSVLSRSFAHPHQKLRLSLREIKKEEVLRSVIDSCSYTVLSLSDGFSPYGVPLSFGYKWGRDPIFYLHCATAGRKLDTIGTNPKGCLTFVGKSTFVPSKTGLACGAGFDYASVIAEGEIEILRTESEKEAALSEIVKQYKQPIGKFSPEMMERVVVLRLTATKLAGKTTADALP